MTPNVPEDRADDAFQHALSRRGLVLGANVEEARVYALTICAELDGGRPLPGVVADVGIGTGLDPEPVGYLIGSAVACYCPHNLPALQREEGPSNE